MKTLYQLPASRVSYLSFGAALVLLVLASCVAVFGFGVSPKTVAMLAAGAVFGLNTVTYSWPVAGTVAPTASVMRGHQSLIATITGDTSVGFTITHNWGLSAAQLAAGFPMVMRTELLAAGYTAAAIVTSKTANTVVFTNTAFTGAGLQFSLLRPWSAIQ